MMPLRETNFHPDNELVTRHEDSLKTFDSKITDILNEPKVRGDWQTLFTHPKLMNQYYWKDRQIHNK